MQKTKKALMNGFSSKLFINSSPLGPGVMTIHSNEDSFSKNFKVDSRSLVL